MMDRPTALLAPALALALALPSPPALPAQPEAGSAETVPVPGSMLTRGVPPIPAAAVEDLRPFENIRSARVEDWHPRERRLLITTRFAQTRQVHEVDRPAGARRQLTFYEEPVANALYRPGRPEQLAFTRDEGGDENFQIFLLDRSTGRTRRLSDGVHRHEGLLWSPDGSQLAYVSNARNGREFDLYGFEIETGRERRLAEASRPGIWFPADWSADGRRILLVRFISVNEAYLEAVEVETGVVRPLSPREGEPASYWDARWSRDGSSVYTTTDRDSELLRLVRLDLPAGLPTVLSEEIPWDVESFDLSDDGALLGFFTNEDGLSRLHLLDARSGEELPAPDLPPGVASRLRFRPGSRELAFNLSWARSPTDVYSYDPEGGNLERWTESEVGGLDTDRMVLPELVRFPTFDRLPAEGRGAEGERRTIPAFVYRPPADRHPGPRPVYVTFHGGPESQWRPHFLGSESYLVQELGVALVYPNVRGSSGYGKSYLRLDNGRLREGAVRDVGALLDWIAGQPDLDASRVMVGGGSYGGFMVLASLVAHGDRLRAGYDAVGISNFVSFLENTEEYRRDMRRVEYGDERIPEMRRFLEEISPLARVGEVDTPLLVAQGANDPRVPRTESEQMVQALEENGTPVWYLLATDEGHGFHKKANTDYLRAVWIEFIQRFLLPPAPAAGSGG